MSAAEARVRYLMALLVLVSAPSVWACINDTDCTTNGTACGTDVCEWTRGMSCLPATEGLDGGLMPTGWCGTQAHCKCPGAKCVLSHCEYIVPIDLAGADFTVLDMLKPPDLTPVPPDLTPPPDLFGVVADLTPGPADLGVVDLSASVTGDLSSTPDLSKADQSAASCDHDTECPDSQCGGQVCQWGATHTCVAAGTDPQGEDGWCNTDDECKCKAAGATCNLTTLHCTFTKVEPKKSKGCSTVPGDGAAPALALLVLAAIGLGRRAPRRT